MAKAERAGASAIPFRDAIADFAHVPCHLMADYGDGRPFVTVAIPTFRRLNFLVESVESALEQRFDRPVEVIVVDNDPTSTGAADLLERLPRLKNARFRYYRNAENIGMYPNHNRCIELARSEWLTILNDDDLLDPDFLQTVFATLDHRADISGLVARKRNSDERGEKAVARHSLVRRAAARLLLESYFTGGQLRPITLRKLFWGPLAGNLAGFLFRRDKALEIGGFYPEDENSGDYWFYNRFAFRFGLWQARAVKATIRIAQNESAKPEVLESFFRQSYRLQQTLPGSGVPRWWSRFSPMMIARQKGEYRKMWHTDMPQDQIEADLGLKLPRDRPILYRAVRLALRGF